MLFAVWPDLANFKVIGRNFTLKSWLLGSSENYNDQVKNWYGYMFGQLELKVGLYVLSASGHTGPFLLLYPIDPVRFC